MVYIFLKQQPLSQPKWKLFSKGSCLENLSSAPVVFFFYDLIISPCIWKFDLLAPNLFAPSYFWIYLDHKLVVKSMADQLPHCSLGSENVIFGCQFMTGALDIENWIFPKVIIYENVLKVGRFFTAQKTLPYLRYAFCKNLFTCCVHDKVKIHHILFNYLTY